MALLTVTDLRLEYRGRSGPLCAVDGVSFDIEGPGEALGIIGESGSGKSSLANAIMRVLPRSAQVTGGSVLFEGRDLLTMSEETLRREVRWSGIAMVFQGAQHALNPVLRVGDQVAERLILDGMTKPQARAEVGRLLDRVGLPDGSIERYPHELSGGMKQRVMIAMALTHRPRLLLLDEPTSALDVSVQAQIMNLLKTLKWELGISMLFITHDLALASDLCDRLAVMYAGQLREVGSAADVLLAARDPYAQGLLASLGGPTAESAPTFLPGVPPDLHQPPAGCRFAPRCRLAFEQCGEPPPLIEVGAGHQARCWLAAQRSEP
jgi:oligopeptide/dipeptide ABC transporter ATP-binding protein